MPLSPPPPPPNHEPPKPFLKSFAPFPYSSSNLHALSASKTTPCATDTVPLSANATSSWNPKSAEEGLSSAHQLKEIHPESIWVCSNRPSSFPFWICPHRDHVKEMAIVIAKANKVRNLCDFLKDMSRRWSSCLTTTMTITCLIKVLGEEGLVNEALCAFYRMKQFHCKPDVYMLTMQSFMLLVVLGSSRRPNFSWNKWNYQGFATRQTSILIPF
ncbi:hypothetical protein Ancab_037350 [Ancistrocladus abbreviatus]